jgi:ABC-2 type transport system permease protein
LSGFNDDYVSLLISDLYIPIESLPGWGQIAAAFSPLTYANNRVDTRLKGKHSLDWIILILFTAAFLFIGVRLDKKFRK